MGVMPKPEHPQVGRREFLRATLISAAGLLAACKGDDAETETETGTGDTTGDGDPTGDGDGDPTGDGDGDGDPGRVVVDGFEYFPQSVASGDPRPGSVILWTRVEDAEVNGDLELELELSLAEDFANPLGAIAVVTASVEHDGCVKVRVTDLPEGEVVYYRFVYPKDGTLYASRIGRALSTPSPDADVAVRFAVISCQDYSRWFNALHKLAEQELDFVVHLGDYIYETNGDPDFQIPLPGRTFEFDDSASVIVKSGSPLVS